MTDEFQVELIAMAHGGSALGRHEGRTIFIPYTIPGEIVEAQIIEDRGRIAFAEGVKLIAASSDRVFPRCPHFGPHRCGRCQWQHIAYDAQALIKQDVLADQLARVGGFDDADVRPIIPAPSPWGYHHRMTLIATPEGAFGFPGADPDTLMPIDECHILHPELLDLFERIDFDTGGIRQMTLARGTDGDTMIILYVETEDDAPELHTDLKTSVNLVLPDNEPVNLIGRSHSIYTINGHDFRVTAGSGFRGNPEALPALVDLVRAQIAPGGSVLDLYGGVGLFSAALAPDAEVVTLVESYPPAATDADDNLRDFDNVDIIEGLVEDVLDALDEAETTYTAAVLDPPGDGLTRDVIDKLAASEIPLLVLVASDPATLARDAQRLVRQGYDLGAIMPIDLNPQTY
jgi:23S rRNA (uracil1939-C5)-methyltransferase